MEAPQEMVQVFGRKKTAVAVAVCKRGRGLIKINGCPIELVEPEILRYKVYEPILLLGRARFAGVDMRVRVKGGGHTSQIYAIRQAIAKALVAYYQKFVDEATKKSSSKCCPGYTYFARTMESVQTFGRKKSAVAVSYCKKGRGLIKINGCPIELVEPELLRYKVFEPILLLGSERFAIMDLRIRVKGGGYTSQIYAIRQAIAKSVVSYYQKYVDEAQKKEIKEILVSYDRSLLVADPRRCEPKKFGGPGARARRQKSYR